MSTKPFWALILVLIAGAARGQNERSLTLTLEPGVTLELIRVEKGSFRQGSPLTEPGRNSDESAREVQLTKDFFLGKTPVTRAQFDAFSRATAYRTEAERGTSGGFGWDGQRLSQNPRFNWRSPGFGQEPDHPVTLVSFQDALAFCNWLSARSGKVVVLPTEAEWEYACRAGTTTAWHNGDDPALASSIAWFKPVAGNSTHPASSLPPNAWGFHIGGNVNEWCRDWYGPYSGTTTDPEQKDPKLSDKPRRVLRGGSWLREAPATRSAARYRNDPGSRNADNGFRVLIYAQQSAAAPPGVLLEDPAPPARTLPKNEEPRSAPPLVRAQPTAGPPSFLALIPLVAIALVIFIVVRRAGARRRGNWMRPQSRRTSPRLTTSTTEDGFWVGSADLEPDSLIQYDYSDGQTHRSGQVAFEPGPDGRQFIYTGVKPNHVSVVLAAAAIAEGAMEFLKPPVVPPLTPAVPASPQPTPLPRGRPSAY